MEEYQKRLIEERDSLAVEVERLDAFTETKTFNALSLLERDLTLKQFLAMKEYLYYLNKRIDIIK